MIADELCAWLAEGRAPQREKLTALADHLADIAAMSDADHKRVVREIKKRLNSPKLAAEVTQLVALLVREYAPELPPPAPAAPVAPSPPPDQQVAFEAAIAADPDNRDTYLVYGDWLEQRGDPRGALIAIGTELAKNPTHAKMLAAHRDHLAAHPEILGKLTGCMDMLTDVEWAYGFIRACRVATTQERFDDGLREGQIHALVGDVLDYLLDDPGPGRFLQALTVGMVDFGGNSYQHAIHALAAAPRPTLRTLYIGDFTRDQCELNWATLDGLHALWPRVPNLRELTLRGGSMKQLGPISLPRLERFTTITGGLDAESLEHIARAAWPELRMLSLQIGLGHQGAATNVRFVEPLLAGTTTPKLTSLGILNCGFTDELVDRLVESPLVAQLTALDLSMGTLGERGVDVLCAHAERFGHLVLHIDDNYVTADGCAALRQVFKEVHVGTQRDDAGDPEDRHASAYE
jgi:uncharacterized protein (TIGR02996 family)